jgi:hypothetical protein
MLMVVTARLAGLGTELNLTSTQYQVVPFALDA